MRIVVATETTLRKKVCSILRDRGSLIIPYVGSTMGAKGTPDIFLADKNWSGWIEFKGPTTKIKPIQWQFIQDLRKRKVKAVVMRLFEGHFILDEVFGPFLYNSTFDIPIIGGLLAHDCLRICELPDKR
jgi:hypothetical protein